MSSRSSGADDERATSSLVRLSARPASGLFSRRRNHLSDFTLEQATSCAAAIEAGRTVRPIVPENIENDAARRGTITGRVMLLQKRIFEWSKNLPLWQRDLLAD